MRPADDQVWCNLEGKVLLLQSSTGVYFGLNPVGAFVWERLQRGSSVNELVHAVREQYEAEADAVENDVKQLLTSLHSEGLIRFDDSTG